MRTVTIVVAAIALASCNAKAMQAFESPADAKVAAAVATAQMLIRGRDYTDAMQAIEPSVQPAVLDPLSAGKRREVLELYGLSTWFSGDDDRSHWAWTRLTNEPDATADDWQWRLISASGSLDTADAYAAFDHLRQSSPDTIRAIAPNVLEGIEQNFAALPNAPAAQLQLAEALSSADESDPRADFSPLWLQAAAESLAEGRQDQAASYARRITDPLVMVALRADRRFDGLVASSPGAYDVHALAAGKLAKAQALAAQNPDAAGPKYALASALNDLGRYPEALGVLDAALTAGPAYGEDPELAADLVARKATVLSELGRNDEAIAITQAMCAVCGRKSRFNMEQAHLLLAARRPAEALKLVGDDQPAGLSLQGVAELVAMRACAYHGVGQRREADKALAYLKANLRNDPDAVLGVLLCAGTDDEVAAALVAMLEDPQTRAAALADLQTYHQGKLPPLTAALRARAATIAARPDVQAVLNRVGRVAAYDMPRYAIIG